MEIFAAQLGGASSYHTYSQLRNLLLGLTQQLEQNPKEATGAYNEFQRYLLVAHYFATRAACFVHHQLSSIAAKLTVAMLRYTDIIPVDKAFFEAGQMAKVMSTSLLTQHTLLFYRHKDGRIWHLFSSTDSLTSVM